MTEAPKNPAERAQWKQHNFIENYGLGPEAFKRGLATMYVEQGDAGNAAFLLSQLAVARDMFVCAYERPPVVRPLEPDYAAMERRVLDNLRGLYGYNSTPRSYDYEFFLNALDRTRKACPPFRLTCVYRRLFVAGLV